MQTTLTDDGAEALITALPVCLWYRSHRGEPWELVARVATERDAWALIGIDGRKGGDWLALPAGREP